MTGPVLIAYDGSESSDHAVREAGPLLKGQRAVVLTVWKEGLGFDLVDDPTVVGLPAAPIDVRAARDVDDAARLWAERTAQRGVALAIESGFGEAEGMAVADQIATPVAEMIADEARKRDAQAIVVGAHRQGRLADIALGSVSRDVIRRAPCPVVIVREAPAP